MKEIRQLSMVKGEERFIFRYKVGHEIDVFDCFAEMARNEETSFDWFDAAIMSYQLGRRLELEEIEIGSS